MSHINVRGWKWVISFGLSTLVSYILLHHLFLSAVYSSRIRRLMFWRRLHCNKILVFFRCGHLEGNLHSTDFGYFFLRPVYLASSSFSNSDTIMTSNINVKKLVGYKAVDDYIRSGMLVGLGTGSTAAFVVERLGQKLRDRELKDIVAIPTSERTRELAQSWKIPLVTLEERHDIDVAIDGADEIDNNFNLVKGRGAALLREKLVADNAKDFIIVADESKLQNEGLGTSGAMPVEVVKYCHCFIMQKITNLPSTKGCRAEVRKQDGEPLETDNGNYIVDLYFTSPISDPKALAQDLRGVVGVVEHGLFLDMATTCLVARSDGSVETLKKPQSMR